MGSSTSIILEQFLAKLDKNISITYTYLGPSRNIFYTCLEDFFPIEEQSGLIHSISCRDCASVCVDETTQLLGKIVGQHESDVGGELSVATALFSRSTECGH